MTLNRDTISLSLPSSGVEVDLYAYLTGGELRKLRKIFLDNLVMGADGSIREDQYPASITLEVQDLALKFLIKSLKLPDGTIKVDDEAVQIVDELPANDSDILFNKVNDLYKAADHTLEDKKK